MSKSDKKPAKAKEQGKGIVKAVPSGDRIVVYTPTGPNDTKEIKLSSVEAPRKGWGDRSEEPFAWESRNFLRELLIGKSVAFIIDASVGGEEGKRSRDYGTVLLGSKNVAISSLEAGWLKIKRSDKADFKPASDLAEAEDKAKAANLGVWNTSEEALADAFHPSITEFDGWEKFKSWQGKTFLALVEHVFNGSTLRISLLPSFHEIVVKISGVQAPIKTKKKTEPYSEEALNTSTRYLLHRVVHVTFTAYEKDPKNPTFYGVVSLNGKPIANELLKSGLARFVEWSAPKEEVSTMKALQAAAQKGGVRIWKSGVPKPLASGSDSSFTAVVRQVLSGNQLKVQREGKAEQDTVYLSSIDAPRMGSRDSPDAPFAFEAREFVRKRVIGRKVKCSLDYVIPAFKVKSKKEGGAERTLPPKSCYTVEVSGKNLGLGLVENGLSKVVEHRGQERSPHYNALLLAQDRAKDARLGLHKGKGEETVPLLVTDLSRKENTAQAKAYGQSLQRKGTRIRGIVEHVFNPTRVKILIPKENVMVAVVLAGVRVQPFNPNREKGKRPEDPPYVADALQFVRNVVFQQDVDIEVETTDKYGSLVGHLRYKKKFNLGLQLIEHGWGSVGRKPELHTDLFVNAEGKAKGARLGRWADYDPKAEEAKRRREKEAEEPQKANSEKALVQLTEILSADWFYVQLAGEAAQKPLEELMAGIAAHDWAAQPAHTPAKDEVVAAQFSGDKVWYRALVRRVNEEGIHLFFGDYGNSEVAKAEAIRKLPSDFGLKKLPWQAFECSLAYIKPRTLDQDYGEDAALLIKELAWNKTLAATIEYRDNGALFLNIFVPDEEDGENPPRYLNGILVRQGLAKVQKRLPKKVDRQVVKYLKDEEAAAGKDHLGIWTYKSYRG